MPNKIDPRKCTACGECIEVCPVSPCVYKAEIKKERKRIFVSNPQSCIDCGACISSCPENAISRE